MTLLLLALLASAQEPFEPPVQDRPANFSGAVGLFKVSMKAEPEHVAVHQPIQLVVTVSAVPPVSVLRPPTRPALERDPAFTELFDFDPPPLRERRVGDKWEFFYLLKPKTTKVTEVPELSFCFFNPKFGQDSRGYQQPVADAIPLTVVAATATNTGTAGLNLEQFPPAVLELPEDRDLLHSHEVWSLPSLGALVALLAMPPAAAGLWLLVWRRLYPDAAQRAGLRRSRAARAALSRIATSAPAHIGDAVADYLRQRLDLVAATPTPAEVDLFLRGLTLPAELCARTSDLFQTCDALRYAPLPPAVSDSLRSAAEQVVLDLEAQTWSPLRS